MENYVPENILKLYCDTVWEYDRLKNEIYVFHDSYFPESIGKQCSAEEMYNFYKPMIFPGDVGVWEKNLSREALCKFLDSDENVREFELRLKLEENKPAWYTIAISRIDNDRLIVTDRNIYKNIRSESLQKSVYKIFDGVMYIDVHCGRFVVNYAGVTGGLWDDSLSYDAAMKKIVGRYVSKDNADDVAAQMLLSRVTEELKTKRTYSVYYEMRFDSGKTASKKAIFSYTDSRGNFITVTQMDVSDIADEYKKRITRYKRKSYRDALTGTYNRAYYEAKLCQKRDECVVAMIDLDDFKLLNDTKGHTVGDEALKWFVNNINGIMETDDILIRYGGDEFLLIMQQSDIDKAEGKLKSVQSNISNRCIPGCSGAKLSVSIGAVASKNETIGDAVLRADKLMYIAKNEKNMVVTEKTAFRLNENNEYVFDSQKIKQQILIADDSRINRELLCEFLNDEYRIVTAADGEECIEILKEQAGSISLMLLDLVMPKTDGFGVLEYMNKEGLTDDLPVIVISCACSPDCVRRAYDLGVSDYITEPFDARLIRRRVFNIIRLYSKQQRLISLLSDSIKK